MARMIPPQDRALLQLLGQGADARAGVALGEAQWVELCRRSFERGVAHLLYGRLRQCSGVPAAVLEELRQDYLRSAAENIGRVHHLGRVLALFRERGIAVVVLKGAYLAEAAYGNIVLRRMNDIDLLVREPELARAKSALEDCGFHQQRSAPLEMEYPDSKHLVPFVLAGRRPLTIELHRRLLATQVDAAGPWERSRAARVADVEALTLCAEDLLLYTCLHACIQHHLAMGVVALLDVDAIVHAFAGELDWEAVIARAELWGATQSAALLLGYAAELFGARVPAGVLERLAPGGLAPEVIELADRQLFGAADNATALSITLTRLRHAVGPGAFIAILGERFFPSRAELLVRYGATSPAWLPLIRFVHPFRLLGMHGRSALRLLIGSQGERAADEGQKRGLALAHALGGGAAGRNHETSEPGRAMSTRRSDS